MPDDRPGHGNLKDKTDEGVIAEYNHWIQEISNATSWGAALGAADEFRRAAKSELLRRNITIPEDLT